MGILTRVIFFVLLSTQFVSADIDATQLTTEAESRQFTAVLEAGSASNLLLETLVTDREDDAIKHGVDAFVHTVLRTNPVLKKIIPQAKQHQKVQQGLARILFGRGTSLAMLPSKPGANDGQFVVVKQVAIEAAHALHMPQSGIDDMRVYVLNTPELNASTGSSSAKEFLDVLVYSGLVDLLTREELKAVITHEWMHVKYQHTLDSMLVMAVLYATGQLIIPDTDPDKTIKLANLASTFELQAEHFVHHSRDGAHRVSTPRDKALATALFNTVVSIKNDIVDTILDPRNPLKKGQLFALAKAIANVTTVKPDGATGDVSADIIEKNLLLAQEGSEDSEDAEKAMEEEARKIKLILDGYSRSCETSADRGALVVVGRAVAEMVDIRLLAGKEGNIAANRRQVEINRRDLLAHPDQLEAVRAHLGDHPSLPYRVLQYKDFEESFGYKVYSSPYLRVLDTYLGVAQDIEQRKSGIPMGPDLRDTTDAVDASLSVATLEGFENSLRDVLVTSIMKEFTTKKQKDLKKFMALVEYFSRIASRGESFPERLYERDGLLGALLMQLETLGDDQTARAGVEVIQKLALLRPQLPNFATAPGLGDASSKGGTPINLMPHHIARMQLGQSLTQLERTLVQEVGDSPKKPRKKKPAKRAVGACRDEMGSKGGGSKDKD